MGKCVNKPSINQYVLQFLLARSVTDDPQEIADRIRKIEEIFKNNR